MDAGPAMFAAIAGATRIPLPNTDPKMLSLANALIEKSRFLNQQHHIS